MSKADKGNAEPSMEEILASIRRIISDDKEDDVPVETPAADAPLPVAKPAVPQAGSPKPPEMPIQAPTAAPSPALADPGAAAPSVAAEMPATAPEVVHVPDTPPQEGAEEMELTEILDDEPMPDSSPQESQPAAEVAATIVDDVSEPAAAAAAVATETAMGPSDAAEQVPAADFAAPTDHERSLVSPPVRALSTNMLADLAGAIHARGFVLGNVGMTLEDLIRDLMRPHLKDWLDRNLPGIVERMVRAEIERMVREAEARKDLI
jgi:cell pole-organizing protein PopZ